MYKCAKVPTTTITTRRLRFLTSQIYICEGLNSYSVVVTNLSHLFHIFGMALYFENIKVHLKSTLKQKIPDTNFFPDKCGPVSGFAIKWLLFRIFHNPSFRFAQFDHFSRFLLSVTFTVRSRTSRSGNFCRNPVFQKPHFWSLHMLRIFLVKNFPWQN